MAGVGAKILSTPAAEVTVEFYGIPRHRAGLAEVTVAAGTLAEVLNRVSSHCTGLGDLFEADGSLNRQYLLSIDGNVFVTDLHRPIDAAERLLLLSADAGG